MSIDPDDDLKADWSPNELSVLRSADVDRPPAGSVERTLTAIGVGAALGAGVGVGAGSSIGTAAQVGRMAHGSMWLKWASAALVGGGIAGALILHRHPEKSALSAPSANVLPSPAPVTPVTQPSEPSNAVALAPSAPLASASGPLASTPALVAPSSAAQSAARTDAQDKPDGGKDALAAEIRMIDEARDHLRRGDAAGALATLVRYDTLVKHGGSMRAEATVVRIEAYKVSGDSSRASALGERFLAKNPDSPYAEYVKRILARAN